MTFHLVKSMHIRAQNNNKKNKITAHMTKQCRMSSGPPENSVSTVRVKTKKKQNNDAQWTHSTGGKGSKYQPIKLI